MNLYVEFARHERDAFEKIGSFCLEPLRILHGKRSIVSIDNKVQEITVAKTTRVAVAIFSVLLLPVFVAVTVVGIIATNNSKTHRAALQILQNPPPPPPAAQPTPVVETPKKPEDTIPEYLTWDNEKLVQECRLHTYIIKKLGATDRLLTVYDAPSITISFLHDLTKEQQKFIIENRGVGCIEHDLTSNIFSALRLWDQVQEFVSLADKPAWLAKIETKTSSDYYSTIAESNLELLRKYTPKAPVAIELFKSFSSEWGTPADREAQTAVKASTLLLGALETGDISHPSLGKIFTVLADRYKPMPKYTLEQRKAIKEALGKCMGGDLAVLPAPELLTLMTACFRWDVQIDKPIKLICGTIEQVRDLVYAKNGTEKQDALTSVLAQLGAFPNENAQLIKTFVKDRHATMQSIGESLEFSEKKNGHTRAIVAMAWAASNFDEFDSYFPAWSYLLGQDESLHGPRVFKQDQNLVTELLRHAKGNELSWLLMTRVLLNPPKNPIWTSITDEALNTHFDGMRVPEMAQLFAVTRTRTRLAVPKMMQMLHERGLVQNVLPTLDQSGWLDEWEQIPASEKSEFLDAATDTQVNALFYGSMRNIFSKLNPSRNPGVEWAASEYWQELAQLLKGVKKEQVPHAFQGMLEAAGGCITSYWYTNPESRKNFETFIPALQKLLSALEPANQQYLAENLLPTKEDILSTMSKGFYPSLLVVAMNLRFRQFSPDEFRLVLQRTPNDDLCFLFITLHDNYKRQVVEYFKQLVVTQTQDAFTMIDIVSRLGEISEFLNDAERAYFLEKGVKLDKPQLLLK